MWQSRWTAMVVTLMMTMMCYNQAWAIKDPETGLSFPDKTTCGDGPAKAVAVGVREVTLGVDVYGIVVYLSAKAAKKSVRGTNECVKIHARFVRDVGADKIRETWLKGLKQSGMSANDGTLKKFIGAIKTDMKEKGEMVMVMHNDNVVFKYMGKTVTIAKAKKLASAIKHLYLSSGSPTPALVKDLKQRRLALP